MEPHEIVAGGAYTGEGGVRRVVEIVDGRRYRCPGQAVGFQRSCDAPLEHTGIKTFARWASRRIGQAVAEEAPQPAAAPAAPSPARR